ncbi:MAG: serine--tRNA ligase [archaeon]
MLEARFVRENPELVAKSIEKRFKPGKLAALEEFLALDRQWRSLKQGADELKHSRNVVSREITELKSAGKDASKKLLEAKSIPEKIRALDSEADSLEEKLQQIASLLPNVLHESVPAGKDESENPVVKVFGKPKKFDFELKAHGELAESLGLADFEAGARVSGRGFIYLKGPLALLDIALQRFAIDLLMKKGFVLVEPPFLLGREAYSGVTPLDDFESVMYKVEGEDLFMIATSEHPLVAMHKGMIFSESELPKKYVGISPCFRKEIGAHGVDTRGFFRMHQFNKIEQVVFSVPEESWKHFEEMEENIEEIYSKLGFPTRRVEICSGDLSPKNAKQYDIEAWYPREQKYGEVGSCSNCTSYQSAALGIKYRKGNEKFLVHTLNCTGLATSRALRAILEYCQNEDGSVSIPKALQPYMNGLKEIAPSIKPKK